MTIHPFYPRKLLNEACLNFHIFISWPLFLFSLFLIYPSIWPLNGCGNTDERGILLGITNMKIPFFVVNAFTERPFMGNPAGVVLEARDLANNTMQKIASELHCSETAFVVGGKNSVFDIKFN